MAGQRQKEAEFEECWQRIAQNMAEVINRYAKRAFFGVEPSQ
jgi:hypothetical protein